jgi:AmmeMemoRadiSam system protein B
MRTAICSIIALCLVIPLHAQETRPAKDNVGYCWNGPQMERLMSFLRARAPKARGDLPPLVAGISPHADYRDAGRAYYPLFQKMSAREVVIFGVTHRAIRDKLGQPQDKLIFDSYDNWRGPYGEVAVSPLREYLQERLDQRCWMVNNEAHRMEHSIEALVPFLQYGRRDVRITPMMVTAMSFDTMDGLSAKVAEIVAAYMKENHLELGKDIFVLISADANHYGKDFNNVHFGEGLEAHTKATAHDRKLVDTYLQGPISSAKVKELSTQLWGKDFKSYGKVVWCGQYSIPFGLLTVNHLTQKLFPDRRLVGKPLLYGDSYSEGLLPAEDAGLGLNRPSSLGHWVGYFSAGFHLE